MQTKEQIKEKVLQMIPDVVEGMTKNLDKVLSEMDGVVDCKKYDDNYLLPKTILRALLKEEQFQYTPLPNEKEASKLITKIYALI